MKSGKLNTRFEAWNQALAQIFDGPISGNEIEGLLSSVLDFDIFMIFQYTEGVARSISHNADGERKKVIIDDYLHGPFLLDPFYMNSLKHEAVGFLDMRRLSPDQFHRSEFYRHHYHLTRIADEIGISVPGPGSGSYVVSVTRHLGDARFSVSDKEFIRAAAPIIAALCMRLTEISDRPLVDSNMKRIEDAFKSFGEDFLSPREIEIVSLVLKGHSSLSIGEILGISTGTVKIHRKNIYSKLNISSQAELFNRFIRYFTSS